MNRLERLREDLAKLADDSTCNCCWTEEAQVMAETIADAIRSTDLSAYSVEAPSDLSASEPWRTNALWYRHTQDPRLLAAIEYGEGKRAELELTQYREMAEHAQQLERELSALERERDKLTKALRSIADYSPDSHIQPALIARAALKE